MDRDQAIKLMQDLLRRVTEKKASDLFVTAGFPPAIKIDGEIRPQSERALTSEQSATLVRAIMNDRQTKEFDASKECNFAIAPPGIGRFRVSAFVQQGAVGCVIRLINAKIPTFEELDLPPILKEVVLTKRGLVIIVGGTGSGKSTSLAAMVGYRNEKTRGHIVTIEDPVEYVHQHKGCVVTHREVGVDTDSWQAALKNTLRQAPDVILIGEIRDRETMERMFSDRSIRSCSRFSSGKKLMMRSSAWFELFACSVASTRCPVSENWMPYSIVSRSRISPIMMTSGAWRSVFLRAVCQLSVSTPTSRCVTTQPRCVWTYSTGSSIVTMCPRVFSLR